MRAAPVLAALVGLLGLAVDASAQCAGSVAVGGVTSGGLVDDCVALLASEAELVGRGRVLDWDTGLAMADWFGVTVTGGRVARLALGLRGLEGTIPAEPGDLSSLRWLRLSQNDLTGQIPAELGDLSRLEYLDLGSSGLTGQIPFKLGNLSGFFRFNLHTNQLTGCIPVTLQRYEPTINPQQDHLTLPTLPVCEITLSLSPDSVSEGAAATDVTVTASLNSSPLPTATTVSVSRTGGTATSGTDYAAKLPHLLHLHRVGRRGNTHEYSNQSVPRCAPQALVSPCSDGGGLRRPGGFRVVWPAICADG